MKKYKENVVELLKNTKFILPVIFIAILGYGYILTHATVNVDILSADRYFEGAELLGQSRLIAPLLDKIFNIMNFYPFFVDFIAVVLLIVAGSLFCALFKEASNGKIKLSAYIVFTCFFITYPLIMEVFTYTPMGISIALGFIFTVISLISSKEAIETKKYGYLILSAVMIWFSVSLYEAFAVVYILGFFTIKIIEIIYGENEKKLKEIIKEGLIYLIPLIIGILVNYLVATLFKRIFQIPNNNKADRNVLYGKYKFIDVMKYLLHTILVDYVFNAFGYLPITYLIITLVISIIIAIVWSIKKKRSSILLMFFGMQISLILLSIVRGEAAKYRMCQQFQLFVPVIFMIAIQIISDSKVKDVIKKVGIGIICLMLFYQVKDLYRWQYINDIRYQKEKSDLILIGNELLENFDVENKPVVFVGDYELQTSVQEELRVKPNSIHESVLKWYNGISEIKVDIENTWVASTNVQSYISWAMMAHLQEGVPGIELIKYFKYLGYDLKPGTIQMFVEAYSLEDLPKWPKKGSIFETEGREYAEGGYIVVNF